MDRSRRANEPTPLKSSETRSRKPTFSDSGEQQQQPKRELYTLEQNEDARKRYEKANPEAYYLIEALHGLCLKHDNAYPHHCCRAASYIMAGLAGLSVHEGKFDTSRLGMALFSHHWNSDPTHKFIIDLTATQYPEWRDALGTDVLFVDVGTRETKAVLESLGYTQYDTPRDSTDDIAFLTVMNDHEERVREEARKLREDAQREPTSE